jgi:hypothetical protein
MALLGLVDSTTGAGVADASATLEPALGNPSVSGYVLSSTTGGVRSWIAAGGGGDVLLSANNAFTGANTFTNTTGQTIRNAATQDGIILKGRTAGTSSYAVTISPNGLTANRTLNLPDVTGTVPVGTGGANNLTKWTASSGIGSATTSETSVTGAVQLNFAAGTSTGTSTVKGIDAYIQCSGALDNSSSLATTLYAMTYVQPSSAVTANSTYSGVYGRIELNQSSTNSNGSYYTGLYGHVNIPVGSTLNFSTLKSVGVRAFNQLSQGGASGTTLTVNTVIGLDVTASLTASNSGAAVTVTNMYGVRVNSPTTSGSGTNTISNRYGIFVDDTSALNVFKGTALVGNATSLAASWNNIGSAITAKPPMQVLGTSTDTSAIGIARYSADTSGPQLFLAKSRNAAIGSYSDSQSGDSAGAIIFAGVASSEFRGLAQVYAQADAAPSGNWVPGRLRFAIANVLDGSLQAVLQINSSNNVGINGADYGGGSGVIYIENASAPSSNPGTGGILYVESGALKYRSQGGKTTTIATNT